MNHIDEGTIHAWLDGALSEQETRAVETHVAQCAECSAAVAEARGLIAGASRILTALDDVPANVTPKRAPAARAAKRQWRAAPWVTGIAATLMLAIGLTTLNRRDAADSRMASMANEQAAAPLVAQRADSAVVEAPRVATPPPPTKAAVPQPGRATSLQKRAPSLANAATGYAGKAAAPPEAKSEVAQVATASSDSSSKSDRREKSFNAATDTTRLRSLRSAPMQLSEVVVTGIQPSKQLARDQAASMELAGCYKLGAPERQDGTIGIVQRAAGAAAAVAPSTRAAPSAPARERAADFAVPRAPVLVRLDTTRNRVGFIARDQSSDSYLGTWDRVAGDSVRVDLLAHGVFTMAAKDRLNCPER